MDAARCSLCSILGYRGSEVRTTLFSSHCDQHVCEACLQGGDDRSKDVENFFSSLNNWGSQPRETGTWQRMEADLEQAHADTARAQSSQPRRNSTHQLDLLDVDDEEKGSSGHAVDAASAPQVKFRDLLLLGAPGSDAMETQAATEAGCVDTWPCFSGAGGSGDGAMLDSPLIWPEQMMSGGSGPNSPMSPSCNPKADPSRHASGGNQPLDARRRKARQCFFADLSMSAAFAIEAAAAAPGVPTAKFVPSLDSLPRFAGC